MGWLLNDTRIAMTEDSMPFAGTDRNRRRFLKGVGTGALAALAGCGGRGDGGDQSTPTEGQSTPTEGESQSGGGQTQTAEEYQGPENIRFAALSISVELENAIKRFEEDTGWSVELMELPNVAYKQALGTWLGTSNAPDVYFYWDGPARAGTFVAQGNALRLNDYLDQDYLDGFVPGLMDVQKYDGRDIFSWKNGDDIWGLPFSHRGYAIWYNKNVLEEAGVDFSDWRLKTDMTAEEFVSVSQTVKDAGFVPMVVGNKGRWNFLYHIAWALQKHAGAKAYQDTALNRNDMKWTDQIYVDALTFLQDYADDYINDSANGIGQHAEASTMFFNDQAAFISLGMWIGQVMGGLAPDSFEATDMGFMWWPYFPDVYSNGQNERVGGGGDGYQASARAKQRGREEYAVKFLRDYVVSDEMMAEIAGPPLLNAPARTTPWENLDSLDHLQSLAKEHQDQLAEADFFTPVPDLVCPPQQSNAFLSGGQQLLSGEDPKKILQSVEKARQADIKLYSP